METALLQDDQTTGQQIRFQDRNGQIWLDEQRVLLLQLSSLADFRKEQIETVGQERAKGFFMRLGYSLGQKDAQLALRLSKSKEIRDLIRAGFSLSSLKGLVRIEELELQVDQTDETFYAEYLMHDSYEAEMFQHELGILQEPACWSLAGHASAFASALTGQEILFKEVSCRGAGDTECKLIGKPTAEWEDGLEYRQYFSKAPIIEELYELQSQISVLRHKVENESTLGNFKGRSEGNQQVCKLANRAAEADITVLLLGETGVGKELVARGIHDASPRKDQSFVAVNCAAIPPDLIESELFGVEKGAYTGAVQSREGRFERAHNGTIFLDEVIELTPRAQATLLRVLQEGELERVGDNRTRKIDVRIVAATNESLEEAVQQGRFRADLYYRLNVYPINIPPLRERREDITLLIDHFLEKYQAFYNKRIAGLSSKAMRAMLAYDWPGNVRELENLIERGMILTDANEQICVHSLFPTLERQPVYEEENGGSGSEQQNWILTALDDCESLEEIERKFIDYALSTANGNVSEASRVLGISRPTLAYRMKKMEEQA